MSYTVQSGDSFWSIGQKLGVSADQLQAANPGVSATSLQLGEVLHVPGGSGGSGPYTVAPGDTLWAIAQKYGISVDALQAANSGVNATNLQIGQVILVPGGGSGGTGSAPPPPSDNNYVNYGGPASDFPDPAQWADYDTLWRQNTRLMKFHDSDDEIAMIKTAVETVASESGIDVRAILCIVVQESGGNVRIQSTNNGVNNPGLMQSHNGVSFNPQDPAGSILQMVRDGTEGTRDGPGLKQLYAQYGNYYAAFRAYNSGSVNLNDLNDPVGATGSYVRDAGNRLMGHNWPAM